MRLRTRSGRSVNPEDCRRISCRCLVGRTACRAARRTAPVDRRLAATAVSSREGPGGKHDEQRRQLAPQPEGRVPRMTRRATAHRQSRHHQRFATRGALEHTRPSRNSVGCRQRALPGGKTQAGHRRVTGRRRPTTLSSSSAASSSGREPSLSHPSTCRRRHTGVGRDGSPAPAHPRGSGRHAEVGGRDVHGAVRSARHTQSPRLCLLRRDPRRVATCRCRLRLRLPGLLPRPRQAHRGDPDNVRCLSGPPDPRPARAPTGRE